MLSEKNMQYLVESVQNVSLEIEALYAKANCATFATFAMSIGSYCDLDYAHLELRYDTSKALPSVISEK